MVKVAEQDVLELQQLSPKFISTHVITKYGKLHYSTLIRVVESCTMALIQHMKPKKCMFHTTEVDFLSMIVGCDGIKMDQEKVKAILEWPEPKMVKGVRSFLGLANFYWRFIKDYAKVARPLHDLTKKKNPFHWEERQQVVFDMLKLHFTTAPILAFPDIDCVLCLKSNASDYTTGIVLSIEKEGVWHPIAFSSHSMMPQEWNYPIVDKEMLSVIQALEQWCHYVSRRC